jgi:hypothetical protein
MKSTIWFLGLFMAGASLQGAVRQAGAAEVTVRGEVLDQHCFIIQHGSGPDHAGCSNACISRNVSIGFLAEDGQFYLLLGESLVSVKDKVEGMAGKKAVLKGFPETRGGLKAIRLKSIEISQ